MKRFFLIILFCFITLISACHKKSEMAFQDNQGQVIQFSKLKGRWIFINYWATWCHACVEELPMLNQFYMANKDKNVLVFGVNYDGLSNDQIMNTIKNLKIQFPVLLGNPEDTLNLGVISVVPTTFVINPNGKMVKTLPGPQTVVTLNQIIQAS